MTSNPTPCYSLHFFLFLFSICLSVSGEKSIYSRSGEWDNTLVQLCRLNQALAFHKHTPHNAASLLGQRKEWVCMGERGTIRSPWPSCWLGFSALQINCCSLTFKASLIELSVAYRAVLSLIALFYQHSTTGQWVVTSNHPVFCNKQICCDLCSINVQS